MLVQSSTVANASPPVAIDDDVCSFLSAANLETILGQPTTAEDHISATPQALVRDCVYFADAGGSQVRLTLSVRQEATSSVAAEGVIDGLREEYPDGASESQVQLGAGFLGLGQVSATAFDYCWDSSGDTCWISLAFGAPPHFFIVNVRRGIGALQTAQTIANAVLENLGQ